MGKTDRQTDTVRESTSTSITTYSRLHKLDLLFVTEDDIFFVYVGKLCQYVPFDFPFFDHKISSATFILIETFVSLLLPFTDNIILVSTPSIPTLLPYSHFLH